MTARPTNPHQPIAKNDASHDPPREQRILNRDLSWLEFNKRVLDNALDPRVPLLERAKFFAIFTSNLDEFYMKRVGLLMRHRRAGSDKRTRDGLSAAQLLDDIRGFVTTLNRTQADAYRNDLRPALAEAGIRVLHAHELDDDQRAAADRWFLSSAFPILTPLTVDPGHRFPFISNLSSNLGVLVAAPGGTERHFARVKIPDVLPQLVALPGPDDRTDFVPLLDIVEANLSHLFPGMDIVEVLPFRVTRNASIGTDDEDPEDLLAHVEAELRRRRFADVVRLEHAPARGRDVLDFLIHELRLEDDCVYESPGPLDFNDLFELAELDRPELKETPWKPAAPPALADPELDLFGAIRERDILVHHPYESFQASAERYVAAAARDPDVLAIKQTLYRTSRDSPFVRSLIHAAERGKQVACLVELRARFDEQKNVRFARQLEKAGVHVAYGVIGLKTHCKCSLVVRREHDGLRTYAHIGTGNYHPHTAQLYTDLGLLTADPDLTREVLTLFNELTGIAHDRHYEHLLVAPNDMRNRFNQLIDREIQHAQQGKPARIAAKMNALEDLDITERLYAASRAGVRIDLVVRGFCCLRPGVPGLSDTVTVRSIVGRFLEHSRIYHFANAHEDPAQGDWFFGSADWMYRNLNDRVEAITPVADSHARERLAHLMHVHMQDRRNAWQLNPDGSYHRLEPGNDAGPDSPEVLGTFETLMRDAALHA